jgi:hypothetical protein
MQREKLYILHTTACFTVATSVLKIGKILRNQIPAMQKNRFLICDECIFSLFIT